MKRKTTQKAIRNNYKNIIVVPYCDLQYLLKFREPDYYHTGVYGWNCNIYYINIDTCIVTGYRPFGNIKTRYETNKKYNEQAKKLLNSCEYFINYEETEEQLNNLIKEYIMEACNNG